MTQLAYRDAHTGLWNRRAYDNRYAEISEQDEQTAAIVMVDIDRFKHINDTHGHEVGDAALTALTDAMLCSVRPDDFVARYGGDEFAILLPDTDVPTAVGIAERIRERLRTGRHRPASHDQHRHLIHPQHPPGDVPRGRPRPLQSKEAGSRPNRRCAPVT